ncbi:MULTISPECIES: extracellular solute-binding protein [Fusobacterium]|jgi:putative aldouronate transport system substrate-binding protein|uniref:Extracellular solute-binding protein n=1 Tax=Fusobacterium hominis TaxID=2764326 RepID=A0A7G9GWF7_9FUSO|nr:MULTISPECIES: extracellular solute-binding protein [Fusobacterium]QNM15139.1 extracellular solute-binding protein [Fusobacterium hominis]
MKNKNILSTIFGCIACATIINAQGEYQITPKPTEVTILAIQNGKVFDENWSVFQEAFKDTNIKLKGVGSKNQTDEIQAFNLAVASGDLPDIISLAYPDKLEDLGMQGGMIPLNELIDKHAPNIKAFFDKYPRYKKDAVAADGNIYFIPDYYDWYAMKAAQGLYIRKDWLNKLNLPVPNTMEEYYNTLKAFKTQDPNGNGLADEVPYFERSSEFAEKELLGLFGAEIGFYVDGDTVKFGPTQPRFKEAMKEIIKWYKEGLIDQEIFTRGFQSRDYMLRNNLGGSTFDWFSSTTSYNNDADLKAKVKDFEFVAIAPPLYQGKRYAPDARTTYLGGWGITATAKDPVAIIKYFDYWFSEKGYEISNWGIEGDTFKRDKDGNKYFTDKVMKANNKTPLQVLRDEGVQFRIGGAQDYQYEKAWGDPQASEWMEWYTKEGFIVDPMPTLKYTVEESKKIQKIKTQLDMTVKEMCQKWILGAEDFDATYDQFIKRLNNLGLDEAVKINQQAYDRFMKS